MRTKRPKTSLAAEQAAPVRKMLQDLLKAKVRNARDKEKLARAIGKSTAHIDGMIYMGEGGLDSWVSAMIECYQVDPKSITDFLSNYNHLLKSAAKVRESEKYWQQLDEVLSEEAKCFLANLIKKSIELHRGDFFRG